MLTLPEFTNRFEAYAACQFRNGDSSLYAPVRYIMALGGKRLRPYAVYTSYQLYKPDVEYVLPLAYTLELFHNYTLVHDDIMDEAPLRRGQHTVHKQFGIPAAILAGDVMMIQCYRYIQENYNLPIAQQLSACLTHTAIAICEGQQEDMDFEKEDHVSMDRYIHMISRKTAILLGCAFQCGAIAAGAPESAALYLEQFGTATGMAFQIQDDLLDVFGGPETGKQVAGDVVQKKKNYLYVKMLNVLSRDKQDEFIRLYHDSNLLVEDRVNQVLDRYNALSISAYATQDIEQWINQAHNALEQLQLPAHKIEPLYALVNFIMNRKK